MVKQVNSVMKNMSVGLSIVAIIVGSAISVYAYINSITDTKIEVHTKAVTELQDQKFFSKSEGIVLQTQFKEIEKKLDKIILTQEDIYKELKSKR